MKKVLGSHAVVKLGKTVTMAVLECGHEVEYDAVKWPEGVAECPIKEHDSDGKAMVAPPTPPLGPSLQ